MGNCNEGSYCWRKSGNKMRSTSLTFSSMNASFFFFFGLFFLGSQAFPQLFGQLPQFVSQYSKDIFLLHMKKYHFVCLICMGATFQRMRKANTPKITFLRPFFE